MHGFHAVYPKDDCPHCTVDNIKPLQAILDAGVKISSACAGCAHQGEVWVCLKCAQVCCSRYVQGHMALHNQDNPEHIIAMSFADFSYWCYECDSYVVHPLLSHANRDHPEGFYVQKFGASNDN